MRHVSQAAEMRLFDIAKQKELKLSGALQDLQGKKIVLVGEQHDRGGIMWPSSRSSKLFTGAALP